jgi:hypothetical protein
MPGCVQGRKCTKSEYTNIDSIVRSPSDLVDKFSTLCGSKVRGPAPRRGLQQCVLSIRVTLTCHKAFAPSSCPQYHLPHHPRLRPAADQREQPMPFPCPSWNLGVMDVVYNVDCSSTPATSGLRHLIQAQNHASSMQLVRVCVSNVWRPQLGLLTWKITCRKCTSWTRACTACLAGRKIV